MPNKKKLGVVYDEIHKFIISKSLPMKVMSRKEVMFILGTLFHISVERRDKVFHELLEYGYITEICKGNYKVLGTSSLL